MKRSILMSASLLAITALLMSASPRAIVVQASPAADPTTLQCGFWLNNCMQAANANYNSCVSAGGNGTSCALMAEAQADACIEGLWSAGCSTFPYDCYLIDVRLPYAKACAAAEE